LVLDNILAKRSSHNDAESPLDLSAPLALSTVNQMSSSDTYIQTPSLFTNTTKKLDIRKELQLVKDHIKTIEEILCQFDQLDSVEYFLNHCEKFLSPKLIVIIKLHLREKGVIDIVKK